MKISTRGRYAVRLMIDIAENGEGGCVSLKDSAKRLGVSLKYLEQIVTLLTRGGFLISRRGAQGGYELTAPADECRIGDILRTTEGSLAPVTCLEAGELPCERESECPTVSLWKGLYGVISGYLDGVTVADLAGSGRELCKTE